MIKNNFRRGSLFPEPDEELLRIYGYQLCPFVEQVLIILSAKEIDHEVIYVDINNKPEWLFERSPGGRVPILELGGPPKILYDSGVIVDYLEHAYKDKKALWPADAYMRARDKVICEGMNKVETAFSDIVHRRREPEQALGSIEEDFVAIQHVFDERETRFLDSDDAPGMADYLIWPWLERLPALLQVISERMGVFDVNFGLLTEKFTFLDEYPEYMLDDPVIMKLALPDEVHQEYYEAILNAHEPDPLFQTDETPS